MKILVTGGLGQLGNSLKKISKDYDFEFVFTDLEELDITNEKQVEDFLSCDDFSFVINTAAYTAVDNAEKEQEKCNLINNVAVENLAKACQKNHVFLIHISTDYVFDGKQSFPYTPFDKTNPLGVYGKTKLEGEQAIIASGCKYIILRTAWLYSEFGKNFVKTMLNLTATKPQLKVVFDQVGTPTYALDLANAIYDIVNGRKYEGNTGIYHYSNYKMSTNNC